MHERTKRDLDCLKQGLANDISSRRLIRQLVDEFSLPDGKYELVSITAGIMSKYASPYRLFMEFFLPASAPIKYGTAVIGGSVRVAIEVYADSPGEGMDLEVSHHGGPIENDEEIHYHFTMRLLEDRTDPNKVCTA